MICEQCDKEVVVVGMSIAAASPDDVESVRRSIEEEGKLALFNPPPFPPYHCPECGSELVEG